MRVRSRHSSSCRSILGGKGDQLVCFNNSEEQFALKVVGSARGGAKMMA